METFIEAKDLAINSQFAKQKQETINGLRFEVIDKPIVDLIERFVKLPYCFPMQSCYGHFLYKNQTNTKNIEPLHILGDNSKVEYRIAYIAICVDNNELGKELLNDLSKLPLIDTQYIQYGSAVWFWERQINSYVLQVEPERYKTSDRCTIEYREALHIEKVRNAFYGRLRKDFEKRL